jgi:hypothetical protein
MNLGIPYMARKEFTLQMSNCQINKGLFSINPTHSTGKCNSNRTICSVLHEEKATVHKPNFDMLKYKEVFCTVRFWNKRKKQICHFLGT